MATAGRGRSTAKVLPETGASGTVSSRLKGQHRVGRGHSKDPGGRLGSQDGVPVLSEPRWPPGDPAIKAACLAEYREPPEFQALSPTLVGRPLEVAQWTRELSV